MGTLIYTPGIEVVIDTIEHGPLDISDDLVSGNIRRVENGVSSAKLVLANQRRKYDRAFTPNDRISIKLKRIRWMPVFTGYLDKVPYFSAWSRNVSIDASCSLKLPQFWLWDPYTSASVDLLNTAAPGSEVPRGEGGSLDGGMSLRAKALLTEVVQWDEDRIHIGEIPQSWFDRLSDLYGDVADSLEGNYQASILGGAPSVAGGSGMGAAPGGASGEGASIQGLGNFATGRLPHTRGKVSGFGGPNGGAYGPMNLTLESGRSPGVPGDPDGLWYAAMRFPYFKSNTTKTNPNERWPRGLLSDNDFHAAKAWWKNRRILVTSEKTGQQAVLRCADWGPAEWTDRVLDVAPNVYRAIGVDTDDIVLIEFAPEGMPLGVVQGDPARIGAPYRSDDPSSPLLDSLRGSGIIVNATPGGDLPTRNPPTQQRPFPIPSGINPGSRDFVWGGFPYGESGKIPASNLQSMGAIGLANHSLHPIAARAYIAMYNAAKRDGITLNITDSFRSYAAQVDVKRRKPNLAATAGYSNHGWGLAVDGIYGGFSSATYRWLTANGPRFGWVNPPWAQQNGSKPEHWHWEFWGIFNYVASDGSIPTVSGNGSGGGGGAGGLADGRPLFNAAYYTQRYNPESDFLGGPLALINDEPVMKTLQVLMNASNRSFSSAPNGDFIAWFPDYFGTYQTAGRLKVHPVELLDFTMDWTDQHLKTHQYVTGAMHEGANSASPGGPMNAYSKFMSHGVASIEYPELLTALFNVSRDTIMSEPGLILRRFGARVDHVNMPTIHGREAEFWYAVFRFQRNWTEQYRSQVPTTFLPEAYPGMLMQIEELGFQAYIQEVTHSFNFSDGGGFKTNLSITAPSTLDDGGGLLGLPRAGPRRDTSPNPTVGDV